MMFFENVSEISILYKNVWIKMIKTTVIPKSTHFDLVLPSQYVGKKIDILIYAQTEVMEKKIIKQKEKLLKLLENGPVMSDEQYNSYLEQKKEWN